ncbi:hypothetical protein QCA50_018746 [Cerrena zonata]|uniref:FH2 domain-containing protein n=1 Tax=Cerrena zonata TaxID=2478898 RepID=A0AAW0FKZ2_9APHY
MIGSDAVSVLNSSIQRLMDRMTTDDTARRAVLETRELTRTVKVLEEEKKQLELEASFGLNQTVANLKKENGLSAIKIAALEKQIDSLQMKIKYLTEERQKWIKFASSNKNNASSIQDSPSSPPYRANSVRHNSIVSELETVYSTKSGRSNNDKITIDLSKDDFVNSDDISIISENYPSRSKSVRSKYSYTAPKSSDSETFDNKVKEDVEESTTKNTESEKLDEASSKPAQPAVPPPPPPPPVPFFLTAKASERLANVAPGAQTQGAPPPPPPPPPIPNFMKAARVPADSDQGSAGPPAPPPPPPLPPNMAPFSPALPLSQSNSQPGTPVGQQSNDNSFVDRSTSFNDLTDNGSFGELLQNNSQISLIPHVRPKTKLKQMHWDKLDAIDKTFWSDIQHEELADKLVEKGVLKEVERAFVAKSSVIKLKKDVKSESGNSSKISFLPRDLAQQFGINLHITLP